MSESSQETEPTSEISFSGGTSPRKRGTEEVGRCPGGTGTSGGTQALPATLPKAEWERVKCPVSLFLLPSVSEKGLPWISHNLRKESLHSLAPPHVEDTGQGGQRMEWSWVEPGRTGRGTEKLQQPAPGCAFSYLIFAMIQLGRFSIVSPLHKSTVRRGEVIGSRSSSNLVVESRLRPGRSESRAIPPADATSLSPPKWLRSDEIVTKSTWGIKNLRIKFNYLMTAFSPQGHICTFISIPGRLSILRHICLREWEEGFHSETSWPS